jgi:hypothetical protein
MKKEKDAPGLKCGNASFGNASEGPSDELSQITNNQISFLLLNPN